MRRRFNDQNCSVAQALEVLGDWWTLLVVREASVGVRRFADFEANLDISKLQGYVRRTLKLVGCLL